MTHRTPRLGLTPGQGVGGQMSGHLTPGMVTGGCVCRHVGLGPDLGPDLGLGLGLGLGFGVPSESANVGRRVGLGPDLGPGLGLGLGLGLGSECRVNPLTSPRQSVAAACAVSPDLCAHTYDPFYLRAL